MTPPLELVCREGTIGLKVKVKPKSHRTAITAIDDDGTLVVSLAAAPHDGLANRELIHFLANIAGLPRTRVELVAGPSSRVKLIRFHGADAADLRQRLTPKL